MFRKIFVCALAVAATVALGAPAHAAKPVKTTYHSASANAFWYFSEELAGNTFRETVWYIGVYRDDYGTFSDLYRTTTTCRRTRCTSDYAFGYTDAVNFTMAPDLSSAHLEGTYVLELFDGGRRPTGGTQTVDAVADFTGVGDLQTNGGSYTYRDDFVSIRATFDDAFRAAEAEGWIDGDSLGETYDAYLSSSSSTTVERTR